MPTRPRRVLTRAKSPPQRRALPDRFDGKHTPSVLASSFLFFSFLFFTFSISLYARRGGHRRPDPFSLLHRRLAVSHLKATISYDGFRVTVKGRDGWIQFSRFQARPDRADALTHGLSSLLVERGGLLLQRESCTPRSRLNRLFTRHFFPN